MDSFNYILAVAAGIVIFLVVEKIVRYVEENSGGTNAWGHGHHHHHHSKKLKDDNNSHDDLLSESSSGKDGRKQNSEGEVENEVIHDSLKENSHHDSQLRKVSSIVGMLIYVRTSARLCCTFILCQIWNCHLLVCLHLA